MNNNENIKLKLYKDGEEISLHENKTEDIEVRKDTAEEHKYILEVSYENNKNTDTKTELQNIQIKVHSEQVKI